MSKSKSVWEYFGENDPYFAVNTLSEMRSETIDKDTIALFFQRGEEYIERIWSEIEDNFIADFKPGRSLDFGCGVARMTLPIAKRSTEAVGVDISQNMLDVAAENAKTFAVENVSFVQGDDNLSRVSGEFDFIHSFVVFQHIDPKIGEPIFKKMVESLTEDGIGVLHFEYANTVSTPAQNFRFRLYRDFPFVYSLRNFLLRRRKEPLIPMYSYDLNNLLLILQQNDCHNCMMRFTKHGVEGVMLFFQKKKGVLY
jgi:ubiquinone/menaquinone biosynthesis C-methylase UbiE